MWITTVAGKSRSASAKETFARLAKCDGMSVPTSAGSRVSLSTLSRRVFDAVR